MRNSADIKEVCEEIVAYRNNGEPIKDVIEQTPYTADELIYELALSYLANAKSTEDKLAAVPV